MKIAVLTNEYPPYVYGGAGVHVECLTRELAALDGDRHTVRVMCFGDQHETRSNLQVRGVRPAAELPARDPRHSKLFATLLQDLVMAGMLDDVDIVHCHTWYTHLAGCLTKHLQNVPLVLTTHSLEPHRPWKVEQLGTAYDVSSWVEQVAYEAADGVIAVSESMKHDVLEEYGVAPDRIHVIHNGIDPDEYRPTGRTDALARHGIDPATPYVLFVGRITRQKGIIHLVDAISEIDPGLQIVLCAGAPDTPEIGREMEAHVERVRSKRSGVIWIREMLPRAEVIQLYEHAAVFCCPSVYEPFGIINLEAMACETPVVASRVGGIPEVVVPEETGLLVDLALSPGTFEPADPAAFSSALAAAINRLGRDPERRAKMGRQGRKRVLEQFSWDAIAETTLNLYRTLR
jgi:glycogen synthase